MAAPTEEKTHTFTFLNYNTPKHSALHRRAVKSHISSKYRTAVRQQAEPRYALPQRFAIEPSPPVAHDEESILPVRKQRSPLLVPRKPRQPSTGSPLTIAFSGTRADPFDSLPGQRTPCVESALDYYVQVLSPLHEPLHLAVHMVNPMMTWMFPLILAHESAYHGAVALSQAYFEKRSSPTSPPSLEVGFHRRKAISLLRDQLNHLDGPPHDSALMTVLALASLDVLYQEDTITNRKGLALLVALKGGLHNLGLQGIIKAYLVSFDYFWMLETGAKSIFPLSRRKQLREYPRHPFNSATLSLMATLPPGFSAVAHQGSFGMDVLQILSRIGIFLQVKSSPPHSTVKNTQRSESQDYPDLFDVCSCLHSSSTTEHSLEKNLCLALILFCFTIHSPPSTSSKITAYRGSRQELTRSLPFTKPRNAEERECLIWIWMVLIGSWSLEFKPENNTYSLFDIFFNRFWEATQWEGLEEIMHHFFWHDALGLVWKDAWQEARTIFRSAIFSQAPQLLSNPTPLKGKPHLQSHPERRKFSPESTSGSVSPEVQLADHTKLAEDWPVILPPMLTLDTYVGQMR